MRLGVDLGGTKIEAIVLTDDGEIADRMRVKTPSFDYDATLEILVDVISRLQKLQPNILSVGIGTPGALTPDNLIKNSNSTALNGRAFKKDIEKLLGYKIRVANDANCFALSEALYGAAEGCKTVFGIIIGTGTGGGVVVGKSALKGPNSIAGEWGHNCIPANVKDMIADDRTCYCGRTNCIETVLSGSGLSETFKSITGKDEAAHDIAKLAESGDSQALETLELYCKQLAACLGTVVNILDPDAVVLGGGLSNIDLLYERVPHHLASYVFTTDMQTQVLKARHGDASGARGAACLWPIRKKTRLILTGKRGREEQ